MAAPAVQPAAFQTLAGPPNAILDVSPGDAIDSLSSGRRYTFERRLGAGAYGTVWLCRAAGELRAVKLLPASRPRDQAEEVRQTRRALEAAGELFVPALHEASEASVVGRPNPTARRLLIAMEYIDGTSAGNLAYTTVVPAKVARTILGDVLVALSRLHQLGLIHRDVKGDNVMVSRTGNSYLCDFGISGHEEELRGEGDAAGTPDFMAPELLAEVPQFTTKADVWAFGILAMELATGTTPLKESKLLGGPLDQLAWTALLEPPVVELAPGYPDSWKEAVEACLVRDPEHRVSVDDLMTGRFCRFQGEDGYKYVRAHLENPVFRPAAAN